MDKMQKEEDIFQTPQKFRNTETSKKLLSIPPSPFLEKLGYGTGVNVWKLTHTPKVNAIRSPWAIKNIRKNINGPLCNKYQSLLEREADILKSLDHENIIGFRGYIKSEDGRKCLAMEVGGQSLGDLIEKRVENDLGPYSPQIILRVALNVAKALKYLHEEKRILHGDLKPQNIVIKGDFDEIKLCDFGVSMDLNGSITNENYVGTPIYSAPECLKKCQQQITEKADMFSFGLILFEMMSLIPPHVEDLMDMSDGSFCQNEPDESLLSTNASNVSEMSDSYAEENFGTRPALPSEDLGPEYEQVIEIFYACTEQDPDKRPSARFLIEYLQTILKQSSPCIG